MYRVITMIGMTAAACLVLGCGSGGKEAGTGDLTKAQFITRADSICLQSRKERRAAIAAWERDLPGDEVRAEDVDVGLKQIVAPSMAEEAKALKALAAPAGDEQQILRMLSNLSDGSVAIAKGGSQAIPQSGIPDYEAEAADYGLKVCPNL